MVGTAPHQSLEDARAAMPTTPIADESAGRPMLYSSGTTGRPKGVKRIAPDGTVDTSIDQANPLANLGMALYGWTQDTVYLSPAPLSHAAPLGWSTAVQAMGGTVVMMEHFDAADALKFIEQYRITSAQWVPTHFVRMLKLPAEDRNFQL